MAVNKPDLRRIWAAGAPALNVQDPDDVEAGKFNSGWVAEIPPFEFFNFIQQLMTQGLSHINERGIPEWDTDTAYLGGRSYVTGSDGDVYLAVVDNTGNDPVSDGGTNWKLFLRGLGTEGTSGNSELTVDLNTVVESGMYYVTAGSNFPSGVAAGHLIVNNNEGVDNFELGQLIIASDGTAYSRSRTGASGTWGAWQALKGVDLASKAEAQAHSDNTKYLSSLRVYEAFQQYGLGFSTGGTYQETVDADNLVKAGFFYVTSAAANIPGADNWSVQVLINTDSNNVIQEAASVTNPEIRYTRSKAAGTWGSWVNITPIGIGQTWQNLTGSRTSGVTYTNTTGRTIQVSASMGVTASGQIVSAIVDGVSVLNNPTQGFAVPVSFSIPAGSTYSISAPSGVSSWAELR